VNPACRVERADWSVERALGTVDSLATAAGLREVQVVVNRLVDI
jgi:hypothetical protein